MSLKNKLSNNDTISKIEKKIKLEIYEEKLVDSKCGEIHFKQRGGLLLSCTFCNDNFISLQLFSEHLFETHPFVNYAQTEEVVLKNEILGTSAVHCTEKTINRNITDSENYGENSEIKQDYSECNNSSSKIIKSPKNLNKEIKLEEKIDSITDSSLNESSSQQKIFEFKTLTKITPKGHWKCQICNLICKKGQEKANHVKTHGNVKRFICETCGKSFNHKYKLQVHLKNHTGERPFKCEFCTLSYKCRATLRKHEQTHLNTKLSTKPFKCSICESCFTSKSAKLKHEFRHTASNEKRYECDLCGKNFLSVLNMTGHRKRHKLAGKPFECSQCPKSFKLKYNLTAHERLEHRGEFNYKCDFCDKVFIKICIKRAHELSHTRVGQPFPCDLCEKKYATREGLYKHKKRYHSSNLPPIAYCCQKCGENFANKELFRDHCKKHNLEDRKFGCSDCEARFESELILNNHYYRQHNYNNNSSEAETVNS